MHRFVRVVCCLLFLWPCLSLMGKAIDDAEDGILAEPVGDVPPVPALVTYQLTDSGQQRISVLPIADGTGVRFVRNVNVYASSPNESDLPPLFGKNQIENGAAVFRPQFKFEAGLTYYVEVFFEETTEPSLFSFQIPEVEKISAASVSAVYPSSNELPENLLKFYIHFSHPMSVGNVYDYIHLLDQQGDEVELPFLELGEELWDYDTQRLTLLFDPGRIKSGLVPNLEEGLALEEGGTYSLRIDREWKDAEGQPLVEGF